MHCRFSFIGDFNLEHIFYSFWQNKQRQRKSNFSVVKMCIVVVNSVSTFQKCEHLSYGQCFEYFFVLKSRGCNVSIFRSFKTANSNIFLSKKSKQSQRMIVYLFCIGVSFILSCIKREEMVCVFYFYVVKTFEK